MKKTILRLVIAITMMAMPKVCSAQGLLINSTGMLPWKPVPYNNQSSSQSNYQSNSSGTSNDALLEEWKRRKDNSSQSSSQNNYQFEQMPLSGGLLIDETYYIDENGNKIRYVLDAPVNNSSTSTTRSSSSSSRTCGRCGGRGGCPTCGNTGKMLNTMYGGRTYSTCTSCGGRKVCPSCGR